MPAVSLKERLNTDLREALRGGEERRKSALRVALAALHNAEILAGHPLDDEGVIAVLAKEVKQRRESIEEFSKGARQDLVQREEAELAALMPYLPQQMDRDEIVGAARQAISEVGAAGPADKGKVMAVLMARLRGRADGRLVNEVVTELLSAAT